MKCITNFGYKYNNEINEKKIIGIVFSVMHTGCDYGITISIILISRTKLVQACECSLSINKIKYVYQL